MERNVILHLHNIIKSFVLIEYKAGNRLLRKAVKRNRLPVNRKRMAITKIYGERDNIQYLYYKYIAIMAYHSSTNLHPLPALWFPKWPTHH